MINKFKKFFSGYSAAGPIEYIVAGLGNPGREYENTRHNMGFLAVDTIAEELRFDMKRLKFKALCGDAVVSEKRVLFLKPSTYMNKSGESVIDAMRFYKVPHQNLIVISDDVTLEVGKMRIRRGGSDGGQKGLKNIIYLLGRDDFPRIRLGIGEKPHKDMELAAWVLSRFPKEDGKLLTQVFGNTFEAVRLIVDGQIDKAMNKFN
ncbi:MAG: aminoacyl-tRNA hydrolase [Oscillospiraceae bacterium]|nr:aminoacyl-tRNA hydrolase [Oscillospiraceae bacterium]